MVAEVAPIPLSVFSPEGNPRIVVIGTTGSGKTTLARRLSEILGISHIELDALNWDPEWTQVAIPEFRERTARALEGPAWVADGNYHVVRDIIWSRANTLVWLDYSLWVVLVRLFRRTLRRVLTREELWNGNRERATAQFFSRDSIFLWALKTYGRRRSEYPTLFQDPRWRRLSIVRLSSPRATRGWLTKLASLSRGS